ncbi:ADOP family duplicated permease [Gemmatimonadota bacterium DH-20]|uniref:ADOP family duplicated permease n=1 Tax=Gaopeijia maritima TaxID=3119007 RepID=A0ABU9E8D4_9BACT
MSPPGASPPPHPPGPARRLLERLVAGDPAGPSILGDLHEDFVRVARRRGGFAARWWYRREVVALALDRGAAASSSLLRRNGPVHDMLFRPGWMQDARVGLRRFRREPGFALLLVLVIGLGVGATTAVYSVLRPLLIAPLPFEHPERLVWVENDGDRGSLSSVTSRTSNLRDFRASSRSFDGVTGYFAFFEQSSYALSGDGPPEELVGVGVADDFLDVLGVTPALGRDFTPEEGAWNGPPAVMLTHRLFTNRFEADPDIVGRTITLNGRGWEVVGVLPPSFDFSSVFKPGVPVDILVPFAISDETDRWGNTLSIVGRLRDDASVESAQADLDALLSGIAEAQPDRWGLAARVSPLRDYVSGAFRPVLFLLAGAAGTVILLVCVNVANVLLARSPRRSREIAVRRALGATRGQVVRQQLVESVMLATAGGGVGVLIATLVSRGVARTSGVDIPLLSSVQVEGSALVIALMSALVTGVAVGILPALRAADGSESGTLRSGGRGSSHGKGTRGLLEGLVVAEVAIACVLLLAGGLFLRSFQQVLEVDLGFEPEGALAWTLNPGGAFESVTEEADFYREVSRQLSDLPGVESVGLIDALPLGKNRSWMVRADHQLPSDPPSEIFPHLADPGYRAAMRIPLVEGRDLAWTDTDETDPVVLLNESASAALFPGESAVGRDVMLGPNAWRVVGVVADVRHVGPERPAGLQVYFPITQLWDYGTLDLVVRSDRAAAEVADAVSATLSGLDASMPTRQVTPLPASVDRIVSPRRFALRILSAFGVVALVLVALGIYGVLSHSVSERRKEIAIRMAVGATAESVRRSLVLRTAVLALAGLVIGLAVGLVGTRTVESLLFGVAPTDPLTLVGLTGLLLGVSLLSGTVPAVRASRTNSARVLKE